MDQGSLLPGHDVDMVSHFATDGRFPMAAWAGDAQGEGAIERGMVQDFTGGVQFKAQFIQVSEHACERRVYAHDTKGRTRLQRRERARSSLPTPVRNAL